ncbi:TraQ conjugal transfer family protein [Elizabethkingia ursingii]
MKKLLLLLMAVFTVFTINSCRDEIQGKDEDKNNAQFSFKVERDTDFIEKAVGETNDIKLNIKPNYKFEASKMYIKYTGDKNGVLKMDSITLEQNKEYEVKKTDNILKYTANEEGTHKLKITLTNDRKQSVTEEFELKYAISDFQVNFTPPTGEYYQGQNVTFVGKIIPAKNTNTKGYSIKFNSFDGGIKLNDVSVELGKEYSLPDLNNLSISLNSKKVGQQKLSYTIKNTTVSRDLELNIDVKARQLTIQSLDIQPRNVVPNTEISLVGVLNKTPVKDNNTIKYKTWISRATNNNISGIVTTNGNYMDYPLSTNGAINVKMLAKDAGNYIVNFQAQDEFGNESEVKEFEIIVEAPVEFLGEASAQFNFNYSQKGGAFNPKYGTDLDNWQRTFNAKSGAGNKIVKVEYTLNYNYSGRDFTHTFSDIISSETELKVSGEGQKVGFIGDWDVKNYSPTGTGTLTIKITTDKGQSISKTVNATISAQKK